MKKWEQTKPHINVGTHRHRLHERLRIVPKENYKMILKEAHSYIKTNFKCPHCGDIHRDFLVNINVFKKGMKTKCLNCEKEVIVIAAN